MPIRLSCDCGRALRLRDECAGKRIRCPACQKVLAVPDSDVETSGFIVEESPKPNLSISTKPAEQPKPARPPRLEDDDDDDDDRPRKRKRRKSLDSDPLLKDYYRHLAKPKRRGPLIAISPAVGTGLVMMLVAGAWLVVGLFFGWLFFRPLILFVIGLVAVAKGFMGYGED